MRIPRTLLPNRLKVERYLGPTGLGGPSYGVGVTVAARVDGRRRMVRGPGDTKVQGTAVALVDPSVDAPVQSRVTVDGATYVVLEVVPVQAMGPGMTAKQLTLGSLAP